MVLTGCAGDDTSGSEPPAAKQEAVGFDTYIQTGLTQSRATYPTDADAAGPITDANGKLQSLGFGVFAQSTDGLQWAGYNRATPFNFMWNQQLSWSNASRWTYDPLKYWPNDNQPADNAGATGSRTHSYLQFFAYAPYQAETTPADGFDVKAGSNDGIVAISRNSDNAGESFVYYRTSLEKPFDVDKSVDLLWATKQDCYKYDATSNDNDDGRITDRVPLLFKHAQSKVSIFVRALIDRTSDLTSPAYSTTLDDNSLLYIEDVDIQTPPFYSEGKLLAVSDDETPKWNYDGLSAYEKDGFHFGSTSPTDWANDEVAYSLRWIGQDENPNIPEGIDNQATPEDALTDFEALKAERAGLTSETERQLSAIYPVFMFPPTSTKQAITVRAKYYIITYDPKLTLNNPKYYTIIHNDIKASLGNNTFQFEPNKQYKILLNLGLTSVKFDVYVLDDRGEWILLSAVVKEWDPETREADVE